MIIVFFLGVFFSLFSFFYVVFDFFDDMYGVFIINVNLFLFVFEVVVLDFKVFKRCVVFCKKYIYILNVIINNIVV